MIFLPNGANAGRILGRLVAEFPLEIDLLPAERPFAFSAQRRDENGYLLIQFDPSPQGYIEELSQWEMPGPAIKKILLDCRAVLTVHYRGIDLAGRCLQVIAADLGEGAERCVVENGFGCLLLLDKMMERLTADPSWTWERETFPDLEGVAPSEWIE